MIAYDLGYAEPLACTQLPVWFGKIHEFILKGEKRDPISPSFCRRKEYVHLIEEQYPGYLHELFRSAQKILGANATFYELAESMNQKSACPGENCVTSNIN